MPRMHRLPMDLRMSLPPVLTTTITGAMHRGRWTHAIRGVEARIRLQKLRMRERRRTAAWVSSPYSCRSGTVAAAANTTTPQISAHTARTTIAAATTAGPHSAARNTPADAGIYCAKVVRSGKSVRAILPAIAGKQRSRFSYRSDRLRAGRRIRDVGVLRALTTVTVATALEAGIPTPINAQTTTRKRQQHRADEQQCGETHEREFRTESGHIRRKTHFSGARRSV